MSEKILGLELSANGLTGVVINKSFKKSTLIDACWIPFSIKNDKLATPNCIVQDSKLENKKLNSKWQWDLPSFDEAVTLLLSKLDLKGCSTSALCLPAYFTSFRTLKMPFDSENKIKQILPFEITSHLHTSNANYISDFILINRDITAPTLTHTETAVSTDALSKNREDTHIFTASIPSELMDICFSVLKKHGLQPDIVTSQGFVTPICTAINLSYSKKNKIDHTLFGKRVYDADIFVEITSYNTVISVMIMGNIVAIRSFLNRTDVDTKDKIAKHNSFVQKAIDQTIKGVCQKYDIEISPSIFDYVNIMDHINIDIEDSVILSNDVQWFNAIAAALCSDKRIKIINFCQGEYAKSSFFHKFKHNIIILSIFVAFTLICLFINIQYDTIKLKKELKSLDKAIKERFMQNFPDVKTVVEPLMQMQVKLKEAERKIGFASGKAGLSNVKVIDILYEISNRIPDSLDVEVTRFLITDGKVVMAGTTDNFNSVDQIKSVIEKYDRFKSVTINSATADKTGNRVLFNFIIEVM